MLNAGLSLHPVHLNAGPFLHFNLVFQLIVEE